MVFKIHLSKVYLPQAYVTLADFGYLLRPFVNLDICLSPLLTWISVCRPFVNLDLNDFLSFQSFDIKRT